MKDSIWELSGPKSFINDIVQDLRNGVNVIINIPRFNFIDFDKYLSEALNEELHWYELNPGESNENPINFLENNFFAARDYKIESVVELVEKNDGMKFIWINLEGLSLNIQNQWFLFLKEYAIVCDQKDRFKRLVFILNNNDEKFIQESSSPFLKEHYFFNYVSELDFETIIMNSLLNSNYNYLQLKIIKSTIFEISYPNFDLAYFLIDRVEEVNNFSPKIFETYVLERKINIEKKILLQTNSLIKPKYMSTSSPMYFFWINNLVTFRNNLIQPATLNYFLRGEEHHFFIRQRIWFAQLKVVFPVLEQHRISIIEYLRNNGMAKKLLLMAQINDAKDLYDLEIGEIFHFIVIKKLVQVNKYTNRLIIILRDIRNELAHLRTVSNSKIEILLEAYSDFNSITKHN